MKHAALGLTLLAIAVGCDGGDDAPSADAGSADAAPATPGSCVASEVAFVGFSTCVADQTGSYRCFEGDPTGAKVITLDAPVVALGGSFLHHCALTKAGTIWCAGASPENPELLGHGGAGSQAPVQVTLPRPALALAVGAEHACAALDDGAVWCWGRGKFQALGTPEPDARATPALVPGLDSVKIVALAAGGYHTCAIDESSELWCWGFDRNGQLGLRQRPVVIGGNGAPAKAGLAGVVKAALGMAHSCALAGNGDVVCWGSFTPQAHLAPVGGHDPMPSREPLPEPAIDLAAGLGHACAVGKSGAVYCWGYHGGSDEGGQVQRVQVHARRIFANGFGSCALGEAGLVCWGGVTIHPEPQARPTPSRVEFPTGFQPVELSHGGSAVFARSEPGSLVYWGEQSSLFPAALRPKLVSSYRDVKMVRAAGGNGFCVVTGREAAVHCTPSPTPSGDQPQMEGVVALSAVSTHACAVKSDGTAWCWGRNDTGQLGNGSNIPERQAVQVTALGTEAKDLAVSLDGNCAIKSDGTAWCWGEGVRTPVQLAGVPPVDRLSVRNKEICFRARDGRALCGPYPTPDAPPAFAPLDALGSEVKYITTAGRHRCAIKNDGALWCGGGNNFGALGVGHLAPVAGMVPVPGFTEVTDVSTAGGSTCALKRDGSLWCWGLNGSGQIGDGTRSLNLGPVPICTPP